MKWVTRERPKIDRIGKAVLKINGGSAGQNVKIYEGVKLALRRGCPIDIGDNVSIEKGVVISTSESGKISIWK